MTRIAHFSPEEQRARLHSPFPYYESDKANLFGSVIGGMLKGRSAA